MTKSNTRQTADIAHVVGRKNLIINGGFDIWQRGTSFTSTTAYGADRFVHNNNQGTISRSTTVPTSKGFEYSLQYSGTSADPYLEQRIEGSPVLAGREATFSFWINGDKTDLASVRGFIFDGTYHSINSSLPDLTLEETVGTWNRYSITHTFATGSYTPSVRIDFAEGSASTIQTTGWQLELGSVATDFEHRSYGEELALCQRYFQNYPDQLGGMYHYGPNDPNVHFLFVYPVPMRAIPTVSITVSAGSAGQQLVRDDSMELFSSGVGTSGEARVNSVWMDAEL